MSIALRASIAALLAVSAAQTAQPADLDIDGIPYGALPPVVETADPQVRPIISLPDFWSEVQKSGTFQEVILRVRHRFGSAPIVFQGISVPSGIPTRVTILRIYQREEDALVQLPAVSIDIATSRAGTPPGVRKIVVPLYPFTNSAYR